MTSFSPPKKIIEEWKLDLLSDYRLSKLLDFHFDKTSYLSDLLEENLTTFSELYTKLSAIKQNLVNVFNEKLSSNYETITQDLEDLESFHLDFDEIKKSEKLLKRQVNVLNKEFTQEYESLSKNLPLLEKVYDVSKLCKNSLKFLQNVKLLKSLLVNNEIIDLKKGSLIINDLFLLAKGVDFSGLSFYENEKAFINNTRESLINKTQKKFVSCLQNKQEEEIKICLKTFANLNILSDVITQTGSNMLKTCMNIWKNLLIKDYDQNTILLSFSHELKSVLTECQALSSSIWILQNLLRSFENIEAHITDKTLLNIFDLFWNKEINIIGQSFQKLKENSGKYELNWKVIIRTYPKIFHSFEEFLLKFRETVFLYPEFSEQDNCDFENSMKNFMNPIMFLKDLYYAWIKKELDSKFFLLISNIFSNELIKSKDYFDYNYQNSCRLLSFLQYEFNDNAKSAHIFVKVLYMFLCQLKDFILNLTEKTLKENFEDISVGTIYISLNILSKIGLDSLNFILLNRNNLKIKLADIDEIIEIYQDSIEKLVNRFLEKLYFEILKVFAIIYDNHAKAQKQSFQANAWENLNFLLIQQNPLKFFNLIEKNVRFAELWDEFLFIVINIYSFMMSIFNNSSEKFIEIINKDVDLLNNVIEKISRKDNNNRVSLAIMSIHKLFLLDASNITILVENNPNFLNLVSKNIVIYNFLKRVEKDANLKNKKNENLFDCLSGFFNSNDLRFVVYKELIVGDSGKTNCLEIIENLKRNANISKENEAVKLIEKLMKK